MDRETARLWLENLPMELDFLVPSNPYIVEDYIIEWRKIIKKALAVAIEALS